MRNPLSMFRRHQKVLLAVFGVIIIITFTIGGSVSYYQDTAFRSSREGQVVVSWKHGKYTEEEIFALRNMHARTVRFLDFLVARALQAGGTPRAAGITRDRTGQIRDPGIPRSNAEEQLVQTVILARKARDMGVVINDQAILDFLDQIADYKVPRNEYGGLLRSATGGTMVQQQLFEQLRMELQAQNMRLLASSGMFAITPATAWEYFNRMNRRVKIEVLPLPAEDFVSQVRGEPGEAEIGALYEAGKDRYPNPYSPEPGFKRPLKIAFDYLKADYDQFLAREAAKVSDEEVNAYYQENLADFKVPDLPAAEDAGPAPDAAPVEQDEAEGSAEGSDAQESQPAAEPSESAQPSDRSLPSVTAPLPLDVPEAETPSSETESSEASAAEDSGSAQQALRKRMFFVALAGEQADEAEPPPQAEPAVADGAETAETADSAAADESMVQEEPPAEEESMETSQPPRYKPLEEVADQIRASIARPRAQQAVDEALKQAKREVDAYFRARARARAPVNGRAPAGLAPLDATALAEKYQLIPGETPLLDAREIAEHELGQAYTFSFAQGQVQTIAFAEIAYAEDIPLYRPAQIRSFEVNVEFLYWKTRQEEPYVPELSAIREEVLRAWKLREAAELALAEARSLAAKASTSASLRETLSEPEAARVLETNEFTWMTRGATPGGFGIPSVSSVEGVEAPGPAFMESVFQLQPGEAGVAVNEPQTVIYVVRVISHVPDEQQLRENFLRTGLTDETFFMAFMDQQQLLQDWYRDLEQQMNVKWQRPPEAPLGDEF